MYAAASRKGRVREQPERRGEGNKPPPLKLRVSPAWCGCREGRNIPAIPFFPPPLLGFLLFNQHFRDGGGRATSICHHRSWCGQHSLHLDLGNCWPLEWPHHWLRTPWLSPSTQSLPLPILKAPCQALTLLAGALGGAGWAPDSPSPRPGGNVWLRHLDDCGSASAGEAWGIGRGPVAQTHGDCSKRLCVQQGHSSICVLLILEPICAP